METLIKIEDRQIGDKIVVQWPDGDETEETITAITRSTYNGKFIGWSYSLDPKPNGSNWCMESWIKKEKND
jgi:hypothetical protein